MLTPADIMLGLVLPAIVCAVILLVAWRSWRRGENHDGRWAGGLAVGAAFAIAYGRFVGDFHFPPAASDNWIAYFMAVAAIVGFLFCRLPPAPWLRVAIILATCVALVWPLLDPVIGNAITTTAAVKWTAALSVGMTLWWVLINQLARSGPRVLAPLVLLVTAVGEAAVLGDGGLAQRGGFTLGAMAVILGAVVIVAALTPRFSLAGGGTLTTTIVLFGTMVFAYFNLFPEPTPRMTLAMLLVLVSPLFAWISWVPGLRERSWWVRGAVGLVLVLLGIGLAQRILCR